MSHFAVLVIGEDHDTQLGPYHEFECTGHEDEFIQDVDITEEVMLRVNEKGLQDALEWEGLEDRVVAHESELNKADDHKYGYAIVVDDKLVKAVRRTNPNAKWDWYQVGGRWSNFLKLKAGATGEYGQTSLIHPEPNREGYADQARKGDIDFEGMRNEAQVRAEAEWDKAFSENPGATWKSWEQVMEMFPDDRDAARSFYHAQEGLQAVRKQIDHPFFDADAFLKPREQYVLDARNSACVLYAYVVDSKWVAKGEMGWFGMSDDSVTQEEWNKSVNDYLDSLPDDTLITVVDCHI